MHKSHVVKFVLYGVTFSSGPELEATAEAVKKQLLDKGISNAWVERAEGA